MSELMSQGLNLAMYGMGTVFFFLTLLVLVTRLMSFLVGSGAQSVELPVSESVTTASLDRKKLAIIASAIHRFRENR